MYQRVDEPQDEPLLDSPELVPIKFGIVFTIAVLVVLILALIILRPGTTRRVVQDANTVETQSYHIALTEDSPPLRRARLQDFLTVYPQSEYTSAVKAQLATIAQYETSQWSDLQEVIFDADMTRLDKQYALEEYERDWGPSFLGGRENEIDTLKSQLLQTDAPPPDRTLDTPSSIPDTIDDGALVGGPDGETVTRQDTPSYQNAFGTGKIIPPKVRRNILPDYPRRAERRNIGALVVLSLSIDSDGDVALTDVISVKAEQYEKDFIRAAERAARRTKFFPQTVDGKPQPASGIIKRYRFQLEN